MQRLIKFWYQEKFFLPYLLYPLHIVLYLAVTIRQRLYQYSILKSTKITVPVIIVGNITVGGTGKTPLVIHLVENLVKEGYKIGILSRGYGGRSDNYPVEVTLDTSESITGDEPLMLKQRFKNLSIVVDPDRVRGAQYLVNELHCNLIICDDGLQHYALQRDIEFIVVDGQRNLGNKLLMPLGPLREPKNRLKSVDAVIINHPSTFSVLPIDASNVFSMVLKPIHFVALNDENRVLNTLDFAKHCYAEELSVDAVAGIGNPERFFEQLESLGLPIIQHPFDDHHPFESSDFKDMGGIILMTEKDAVKCRRFATKNMWYLKVEAEVTQSISKRCLLLLKKLA